jgi:hypothetical protein
MPRPVVFISYSHKDEAEKEQLVSHLKVLESAGLIELWVDDRIAGGADWEAEIKQAIAQARVAILLISANFLTSDFILGKEVPAFLERRKSEGLTVFPVIAKACTWNAFDWLARMNVRPKNARPIWSGSDSQIDEDLSAIAKEVVDVVKKSKISQERLDTTSAQVVTSHSTQEQIQGAAIPSTAPKIPRAYNTRTIRELVNISFTAEELRHLCYDEFRAVYMKLSEGMSKETVIHHLIEYCEIQGQLERLLDSIEKQAPHQYALYKDRLMKGAAVTVSTPSHPTVNGPEVDLDSVEHVKKLIATKTRRLHALQLQAAQYGLSTPPEVILQIEDLEAEIAELKQKLKS